MLQFVVVWYICAVIIVPYVHIVSQQCKVYVQCSRHICSVAYSRLLTFMPMYISILYTYGYGVSGHKHSTFGSYIYRLIWLCQIMPIESRIVACVSVGCRTEEKFCGSKFKFRMNMQACNVYAHLLISYCECEFAFGI